MGASREKSQMKMVIVVNQGRGGCISQESLINQCQRNETYSVQKKRKTLRNEREVLGLPSQSAHPRSLNTWAPGRLADNIFGISDAVYSGGCTTPHIEMVISLGISKWGFVQFGKNSRVVVAYPSFLLIRLEYLSTWLWRKCILSFGTDCIPQTGCPKIRSSHRYILLDI